MNAKTPCENHLRARNGRSTDVYVIPVDHKTYNDRRNNRTTDVNVVYGPKVLPVYLKEISHAHPVSDTNLSATCCTV